MNIPEKSLEERTKLHKHVGDDYNMLMLRVNIDSHTRRTTYRRICDYFCFQGVGCWFVATEGHHSIEYARLDSFEPCETTDTPTFKLTGFYYDNATVTYCDQAPKLCEFEIGAFLKRFRPCKPPEIRRII